jgi:class 3 adenylate cyclase/tetratricopeptide (TPR) repeat protein
MKCPQCQFENREGAKFCLECGAKLELKCPQCHKTLPFLAKFCDACGHELKQPQAEPSKGLSFEEKLTKIQRYLPKGLTEKILSQRDRIEGERKQVTVMFCDMEGFTRFSERLGPEAAYTIMDQVYEILIHKVHDYEGTVNEMTGDGIVALFGAPIALEDAPQRAIRSAYAIHREMSKFGDKMKQEKKNISSLKMRVGIHTGPVVVGSLGNDLRVEFKAVGDTVNLASRIEGLAQPGSTYVSEETFRLTEGLFRFEALGEHEVKGKEGPVKAYRVIAPSTTRTRFDVSAERGLTPFMGRARELELLLDAFERSKTSRGQAFSIVAEAGVGKSRLLYEFRKAVSGEDVTFQEGKCLSYSRGVAYHPVVDIVKANFDIVEGDGEIEIRQKLIRGLNILSADEASTLPYLLELLSVEDSGLDTISFSPEAIKDRIIGALNRITIKASQIRPLIMAVEDLHWIDKSSEDVFKYLLDSITGARVFLIFTYRPEFVHTWGAKSYHSQVNLNRLSNRESLAMVTHLLSTKDIDRDLEELILEKAEGVPFFIEEFVRSLKDLHIIERENGTYRLARDIQEMTIPSTIHDVIMARVDTLPEGAKELLQIGSVIEREFSYELMKQVVGLAEQEMLSRLSVLKDSELLYERGIYPESTYLFKNALTREVVYDSILTSRKKKLHKIIAQAIERLYSDNLHEHYGILTEHFISSENYEKGAEYCRMAGKKAVKAGSFDDAIAYVNKQIVCLEKLPQTDAVVKDLIDARTKLGLYYAQMVYFVEAKAAVDPVVDLAIQQNYKKRVSQIFSIIGMHKFLIEEDITEALEYMEEALKIGKELNDIPSIAIANLWMGSCLSQCGEFSKALVCYEKTLQINISVKVQWGIPITKAWIATWVYNFQGKINLSVETSRAAVRIADEIDEIISKLYAYTAHGWSHYYKGNLEEAKDHLLNAAAYSHRINELAWSTFTHYGLGMTYFDMQEYKTSQKHYERAIHLLRHGSLMPSWANVLNVVLAMSKVMNNEKDINLHNIFKCCDDNKFKVFEGWIPYCIGKILLNLDDQRISEAEDWIKKAIAADKKYGMMWYLALDYGLYAEFFKRKSDISKARRNLSKAIEIFKQCGADGWMGKYEKELESLS